MRGEPQAAPRPVSFGQRQFRMRRYTGVQPRGGIAEALANVFAPTAVPFGGIRRSERRFPPLRRPAELPASACAPLGRNQILEIAAQGVAKANPDKVKKFMRENARELGASAVERDATVAEKGSGMYGPTAVPQAGAHLDADGETREGGEAFEERCDPAREDGVTAEKKGGGHSLSRVPPPGG